MSNQFEIGKVRWFHPQKRYGFIIDRWGLDIFFHFNDGRFLIIKGGEVDYGYPKNGNSSLPDPKPGDEVVFELVRGSKGRGKASPWCYRDMYEHLWLEFARGQELCPNCLHREWEHAGALCMVDGCHCGDEAYEHENDEPREVNLGDSPGGFKIYE